MIAIGLHKHEGNLTALGTGCWCVFGGKVFFRCSECAGLYDVKLEQVDDGGVIDFGPLDGPLFFCQTPGCDFVRGIRLWDWRPPLPFDTSDIGGS